MQKANIIIVNQQGWWTRFWLRIDLKNRVNRTLNSVVVIGQELEAAVRRLNNYTAKRSKFLQDQHMENRDTQSFFKSIADRFLMFYPLIVSFMDLIVLNTVLQDITSSIPGKPLFISLLVCLCIVFVEGSFGLFHHWAKKETKANDQVVLDSKGNVITRSKNRRSFTFIAIIVVAAVFVLLIPILSISELRSEIAVSSMQVAMEIQTVEGHEQYVKGLRLKYIGLGLLSFLTHSSMVLFTDRITLAWSGYKVRKKEEEMEMKEEVLRSRCEDLHKVLIASIVEYKQVLSIHKSKFGNHDCLPPRNPFSEFVNSLIPEGYATS